MEGVPTSAQMSSLDLPVAVSMDTDWTLTAKDVLVSKYEHLQMFNFTSLL